MDATDKLESVHAGMVGARKQPSHATTAWQIVREVFREYGLDNGSLMAAAVAFYLLISLIPLVVVGVALFGYVMRDGQARVSVINFASQFVPHQQELLETSIDAVQGARGTLGTVGLLTLLLTATTGFATLETAINTIWRVPNRHFLWSKVYAVLMVVLIGAMFVLSVGVTAAVQWAGSIPGLGWLAASVTAQVLGLLLSIAVSAVMFGAIYKFLPNMHVDWRPALLSGVITAILWELFKQAYTWYTGSRFQGDQTATYGVMAGFVGLLTWIYYSSALVLLGSELTWVLQERAHADRPAASPE